MRPSPPSLTPFFPALPKVPTGRDAVNEHLDTSVMPRKIPRRQPRRPTFGQQTTRTPEVPTFSWIYSDDGTTSVQHYSVFPLFRRQISHQQRIR